MTSYLITALSIFLFISLVLAFIKIRKHNKEQYFKSIQEQVSEHLTKINNEVRKHADQGQIEFMKKYNEMNQRIERDFEAAANKSLAKNLEAIQAVSTKGIEQSLSPVVQELRKYEEKMERMIKEETRERATMSEVIKCVSEINRNFSEEAKRFSLAVRGNIRAIGKFGEDTLQNILEASGYNEGKDYLCQSKVTALGSTSNLKPDFTILLPGKRAVVIDSKLSLDSFISYMEEQDEEKRKCFSKEHYKKIVGHVSDLSKKEYESITEYETLGFVFMFVSSDSAISLALSEDNELLRNAMKKNILIVGPTTMMSTLKTIGYLWREEKQKVNYKEIAQLGKSLFEKSKMFIDKMKDVQKNFEKASEALSVAQNHLCRGDNSIIADAQALKELGINSEKEVA